MSDFTITRNTRSGKAHIQALTLKGVQWLHRHMVMSGQSYVVVDVEGLEDIYRILREAELTYDD